MTHPLAVVLLDGEPFASALADALGKPVYPVTVATIDDTVRELAAETPHIVGLSAWPWPANHGIHQTLGGNHDAYRGVVSWHGLPELAHALADALKGAVSHQAHVLFTSPDPGDDATADTLMFLPQLAEQVSAQVNPGGRSIAWRGERRQPSSVAAFTALVEAHAVTTIVECPVVPGVAPDETLRASALARGVTFVATDLGVATRVGLMRQVVHTVEQVEWNQPD
ncbi:MAG: hypothetical protein WD360_08300 [Nitriliruptoraceae bacterium]